MARFTSSNRGSPDSGALYVCVAKEPNSDIPRSPAWSADGRRIAYLRGYSALEGRVRRQLARSRVLDLWWSPDSRRIYYDDLTG
jgi:Tol biopolymer transport system component